MTRSGDITFAVSELIVADSPDPRVQVPTPADEGARAAPANLGGLVPRSHLIRCARP